MRNLFFLFLATGIYAFAAGQLPDTASLNKNDFNDSFAIRRLIDTAYEKKEIAPFAAIKLSQYASHRAAELKNDNLLAAAINMKADVYSDLQDYETALKLHYESLRIYEKIGNAYSTAMVLNNIGKVYSDAGKLTDAVTYLDKAEQFSNQFRLNKPLLFTYVNAANTYIRLNQLPKALEYALKADELNKRLNEKKVRVSNNNTIGALYYFLNDYDKALEYYTRSKDESLEIHDLNTHYKALINIGEVYEINHRQDPLPYYLQALHYFEEVKNYPTIEYAATDISNYYKSKKDYQLSLDYYQKAVAAGEKNKNMQTTRHMLLLQTQYETEKKEQEISLLNKENTIQKLSIQGRNKTIGIISGVFILSLITGLWLYNRYKFRQKTILQQQALHQREELTRAVIDAEENERKRIASDLHDGVGQLFTAVKMNLTGLFGRVPMEKDGDRFLAEKTLALVDESCKEVRLISHQMMPNAPLQSGIAADVKNFIEKIDSENLKINVEATGFKNRIESNAETVLYRVIQESVNNVIKHAKASRLDILLNRDDSGIRVKITDNGVGFDAQRTEQFTGIGLKNIRARVEYLKGTLEYHSAPGQGTTVQVSVPL